jgi:hypothetical protein
MGALTSHHDLPLLTQSPCAFIYEENDSNIQSRTDGIHWAPVGVQGGFHVGCEPGNIHVGPNRSVVFPLRYRQICG